MRTIGCRADRYTKSRLLGKSCYYRTMEISNERKDGAAVGLSFAAAMRQVGALQGEVLGEEERLASRRERRMFCYKMTDQDRSALKKVAALLRTVPKDAINKAVFLRGLESAVGMRGRVEGKQSAAYREARCLLGASAVISPIIEAFCFKHRHALGRCDKASSDTADPLGQMSLVQWGVRYSDGRLLLCTHLVALQGPLPGEQSISVYFKKEILGQIEAKTPDSEVLKYLEKLLAPLGIVRIS